MSATLSDKIVQAIQTGTPPLISVAELLAAATSSGPVVRVVVSFSEPLALTSLYRLAALTPGVPLGQWLPNEGAIAPIFGDGVAALERVGFTLAVADKKLLAIDTIVLLNRSAGGLNLSVLDSPKVAASVQRVRVRVSSPLAPPRRVDVAIDGSLQLGALVLDLTVTAPELQFSATQRRGDRLSFPALIDGFGLPLASVFEGLFLDNLRLDVLARQKSGYAEVQLGTQDGAPFSLLPGVLALSQMTLVIERAPGNTAASIAAALVVRDKLHLGVRIANDSASSTWQIEGSLDVPGTVAALGKPGGAVVTVADLVTTVFGFPLPAQMQGFLGGVGVEQLAGAATIAKGGTTYTLDAAFNVDWKLADGVVFNARTAIAIADGDATVTGDLDIGGFALSLTYVATKQASDTLTATAPQLEGLEVQYAFGSGDLTFSFTKAPATTLGDLLADFIGLVTGNPYISLPTPWDVLGDVNLRLDRLSLAVNLKTRAITIAYRDGGMVSLFGTSIDGFALSYDSKAARGQRLSFKILGDLTALTGTKEPSFNPEKPSTAPAIPGAGAALFDIRLVAVGHHVALPPASATSVETAVAGVATMARSAGDDPANLPVFTKDAGWLIGGHLIFLGGIDIQLVFADPTIYGLLVQVKRPAPPTKMFPVLEALIGLRAEILYRRISPSIGVYEGRLTLPDRIRKIDFGAFMLQLPSIAVAIYTNGDFLVDVGFPHGGDFSNSLIIEAGQYTGAGGVYYGRLSGETASNLPAVPTQDGKALGAFGSVTAIGIGLRVGLQKGFSSGPLTARFSIVLQAIFEGLFSTYTEFATSKSEDYFDVRASISIIGQLEGELDFKIITASVLVRIEVSVGIRAIAARAISVPVTARVTVKVSVKIDLGLFSIRIHFSFDATVGFTQTFGQNRHALWDPPSAALHGMPGGTPPSLDFVAPPVGLSLPLYVVPQLSRGLRGGADAWIYTLQLALASGTADGKSIVDLAKLVVAWVAHAAYRGDASAKTLDAFYASISLDPDQLEALSDLLQAARSNAAARPTVADLQAWMAVNRFEVAYPSSSGGDVSLGAFPMLPGCKVSFDQGSGDVAVTGDSARQGDLLRDYVLMIALSIFHDAGELEPQKTRTLAHIFADLGAAKLSGAAAMTTRFMLHGTRLSAGGGTQALYQATGQQAVIDQLAAASLTMTLSSDAPSSWGLSFPQAPAQGNNPPPPATKITLTSAAGQLRAPKTIATFPVRPTEAAIAAGAMPTVATVVRPFPLLLGVSGAPATLRRLPRQLLALGDTTFAFALTDDKGAAYTGTYAWCTTVPFDIRRIPTSGSSSAFLTDTFALVGIQSDGLDALLALYRDQTGGKGPALTGLELAWVTESASKSRSLHLVKVERGSAFLFQNNLATGSSGDVAGSGAQIDPTLDFLGRLLAAGLGGAEGHYLYLGVDGGLPAGLFDARGLGRLIAVVSFATSAAGDRLRGYYTAARVADPAEAETGLVARSTAITMEVATVPAGKVGAQLTRPAPADTASYQSSLDNLFNLIAFAPRQIVDAGGHSISTAMSVPPAIGPLDHGDTADADKLVYRHVYDLLDLAKAGCQPNSLADTCSPYRFVGGRLDVGYRWIDLFGDELASDITTSQVPIRFTDPLANLGDWPGLSFGFQVEGGNGAPRRLVLKTTWVPASEDINEPLSDAARAQYATIYHQLGSCTVSASISIADGALAPVAGDPSPRDVLRANIRKILDEVDDATAPVALTDVRFVLPEDDVAYHKDVLAPLHATISFARGDGLADAGFSAAGSDPILRSRSVLAPFHPVIAGQGGDGDLISYRAFARSFETGFASMQLQVLAGSLDGGGQFYALRRGDRGLGITFSPAAGPSARGHAPPPFATSLQSRDGIRPLVNQKLPDGFKLPDAPLSVTNLDVDAAMGAFLTAVERFLAPDFGVPAARVDAAAVDRCVAGKQQLADLLSARVVALGSTGTANQAALDAARESYRQACLVALTGYYSVDAALMLQVGATVPAGARLPALAVHGQPVQEAVSDVSVASGRASLDPAAAAPMALSLSSRNKGWQAAYAVPQSFAIEGFELSTGSVAIATSDEPIVAGARRQRSYRTGEWLRFVLDEHGRVPLSSPAPAVELPLRAYPPAPLLRAQGFSPAPLADSVRARTSGSTLPIREAKSWSLDADYRHTFTAQDTLHVTVVLNEKPVLVVGAGPDEQDLLDALAQFQALYPQIRAVFDAQLASGGNSSELRDAIRAFVALAEHVRDHFAFVPEERDVGSAPTGTGETWVFELRERFTGDVETAPFEAVLDLTTAPKDLTFKLPPPALSIAGAGSYVHEQSAARWVYRFRDSKGRDLTAREAIATPERSVAVAPLDVIDWQNGRYYLQVVRNQGLPRAFVYTTPVVGARDHVLPFVDRTVDIDIATLPKPSYGAGAPPEGSLLDWTARLYLAVLSGTADEQFARRGSVRSSVSLTWPLTAGGVELPRVRLPVTLTLPSPLDFDPSPAQAVALVKPLASAIQTWLDANTTGQRPALQSTGKLDFEVTVFSDVSETGLPILRLGGLTLALATIKRS